jgi:voltage-gated potassium channel
MGIATTNPWRRLLLGGAMLGAVLVVGVAGYMIVEGWSFLDALFMTVTSITTVGYREVQPLDDGGRIFTIFVILFGVGTVFYLLTAAVAAVVEGELGAALGVRRMQQRIEGQRDHYILCGYGRVGEEITRDLVEHGVAFVIVESNPEALSRAQRSGHLYIEGDATQDDILQRAGIERARALLAASDSDAGNTFIVLTAKALNPNLFVVARAGHPQSEPRLERAGADRVISPYSIGGRRMALSALQPAMVDFMDLLSSRQEGDHLLAEILVTEDSPLHGKNVHDALHDCRRTTLLAIQRPNGEVVVGPDAEYRLQAGDRLMVVSNASEVEVLTRAGARVKTA